MTAQAAAEGVDQGQQQQPAAGAPANGGGEQQPPVAPAAAAAAPWEPVIPEFTAYKATRLQDIVCKRVVRLLKDRVQTIHPELCNEKTWYLDRTCKLEPEYVDEVLPEKRTVRSPGQWTVTAKLTTVTGQAAQAPIDLFCVTIHWPTSWLATRGYTSFTLGFETYQEAAQWHVLVQRQLSALRVRAASSKGDSSAGHSSKPSYDEGLGLRAAGSGNGVALGRKQSQGFVAAALEHFWSGSRDDKQLEGCDRSTQGGGGLSSPGAAGRAGDTSQQLLCSGAKITEESLLLDADPEASFTSGYTEVLDGPGQQQQQGLGQGGYVEQRWVPYRHTNGVAIYHHKESAAAASACSLWGASQAGAGDEPAGCEYMASSIVKGCPDECLSVLVDLSSNTTILGPASRIELLEQGQERQVLRLIVEATGMARRLCAPREVIVERLFKREECGVDVILFSSCDEPAGVSSAGARAYTAAAGRASANSSVAGGGITSAGGGRRVHNSSSMMGHGAAATAAALAVAGVAAGAASSWFGCALLLVLAAAALALCRRFNSRERFQSLWYRPVRAYVQGGYTISPQEDCDAVNSPECLVTCILKVDLRGCLGARSLLRPLLDALGWVDAYVERMLMAVILVKDEVEQQRFLVQPFSMLTNNHAARSSSSALTTASGASSAAGAAAAVAAGGLDLQGADQEAATLRQGYSQHIQQQQLLRQRRRQQLQAAGYGRAGAPLASGSAARLPGVAFHHHHAAAAAAGAGGFRAGGSGAAAAAGAPLDDQWPYRGPLGAAGRDSSISRQQQDALLSGGDAAAAAARHRGTQQASRQQGRLGRMASRIYSLRPRLRRSEASSERPGLLGGTAAAAASGLSAAAGMVAQLGASFRGSTAPAAADAAGRASSAAAGTAAAAGAAPATAAEEGAAREQSPAAADAALLLPSLSDTPAVLSSLGLPPDTAVVGPQYYHGGPQGPAAQASTLNTRYWSELHVPGTPAPFKLRGASYLADRTKVDGGVPQFVLGSVDLVETPGPTQHISRFLPAVRANQAAYSFVVNLIIPGTPVLSLVAVFVNEHHPDILDTPGGGSSQHEQEQQQRCELERLTTYGSGALAQHAAAGADAAAVAAARGQPGAGAAAAADTDAASSRYETPVGGRPCDASSEDGSFSAGGGAPPAAAAGALDAAADGGGGDAASSYRRPRDTSDWQPFDFALHRFLHGDGATRQSMFKLIPHIAEGSWVIKQSVGTVPVILGNKLQTLYYQTDRYLEATVDVTSSSAAAYITGMVRGATKSLVIDLGFVLEGQRPEELPEALLGAFRLNHLDCTQAQRIDTSKELPLLPRPLQQHQLVQLQQAAAAAATAASTAEAPKQQQPATAPGAPGPAAAAAAAASGSERSSDAAAAGPDAVAAKGGAGQAREQHAQRRVASTSGAAAAATTAVATMSAAAAERQQHQAAAAADAVEQQPLRHFSQHLQTRCRNSSSVLEGGRTMTGHARSRSAASAEELFSMGGPMDSEPLPIVSQELLQEHRQQRKSGADAAAAGGSLPQAPELEAEASRTSRLGSSQPLAIRTSAAASAASEPAAAASAPPSAARQLFGSLLPFGSHSGASSGSSHHERQSSGDKIGKAAAGGALGGSAAGSPALRACGAVTSLSGAGTPTAAVAAAAAGAFAASPVAAHSSLAVSTAPGSSGRNHQGPAGAGGGGLGTPTAAAAAAATPAVAIAPGSAALRSAHQRTSSGTSDASRAAGAAGAGPWPASPPSAQESAASKLSAAAYISRAHAAALAASAHRRGQRGPAAGSLSSSGGFGSPGLVEGLASALAASPSLTLAAAAAGSGGSFSSAVGDADGTAGLPAGSGGLLQGARLRASSSGMGTDGSSMPFEHASSSGPLSQLLQQQLADTPASGGSKISATEQLRLTQSAIRASATGAGGTGGGSLHGTPLSAGPHSLGAPEAGAGVHQPTKRTSTHRRFASMGQALTRQ